MEDSFFHVEHYRPKSVYYWLAFSWDNLLLCCDKCNVYKSHNFEIENTVAARLEGDDLEQIHQLAAKYNSLEQPKLVHPELENDFEEKLVFDDKGKIYSQDSRCAYTISVCKIDRDSANDSRKKVFDSLRRKIESRFYEYKLGDKEALKEIKGLLRDFAEDAKDENNEYLAFRKYMVRTQKLFKNFSGS